MRNLEILAIILFGTLLCLFIFGVISIIFPNIYRKLDFKVRKLFGNIPDEKHLLNQLWAYRVYALLILIITGTILFQVYSLGQESSR